MKRILLLIAGVVGVLVGLGLIMPAVALWRDQGPGSRDIMPPLLIGVALVLGALFAIIKGCLQPKA
jgi:hypothetical protein